MREQNRRSISRNAAQSLAEVRPVIPIVNASEKYELPAPPQFGVAVAQDFDAAFFERAGHLLRAHAKIVIAENCKSAATRLDGAENLRDRFDIRARVGDEIAGERD